MVVVEVVFGGLSIEMVGVGCVVWVFGVEVLVVALAASATPSGAF